MTDKEYLSTLSGELKKAKRSNPYDVPEGNSVITISDTLANEISLRLFEISERIK